MDEPTPAVICTVCGEHYLLDGITFHDLRAEGYRPRMIHGRKGLPGLCPRHNTDEAGTSDA